MKGVFIKISVKKSNQSLKVHQILIDTKKYKSNKYWFKYKIK